MKKTGLLEPYSLGHTKLSNRIVMSPMTRSRAIDNIPNELMATFYRQRASAGLIITEGTSPSPNGLGYCRIPGIFNEEQIKGWKKVTKAVHAANGKIFLQIMHTGRIGHSANMPANSIIMAPSAVRPAGTMWTDTMGLQEYPVPIAMSTEEIARTKKEYAKGAVNAIQSNFDGIELHCANGYLPEQFLSPISNIRTDRYGGTIENRCRFLLETVHDIIKVVGKQSIGVRLSPYGTASDMPLYPEINATYTYLAGELDRLKVLYIHLVDHSSMGAPMVSAELKNTIRERFHGTIILSGGYTKERADAEVLSGRADLIAFGRPFINNPDLVRRFEYGWTLSQQLDMNTLYTSGEKGYTDYSNHSA
jgi:N-ethylmaleimide reductase